MNICENSGTLLVWKCRRLHVFIKSRIKYVSIKSTRLKPIIVIVFFHGIYSYRNQTSFPFCHEFFNIFFLLFHWFFFSQKNNLTEKYYKRKFFNLLLHVVKRLCHSKHLGFVLQFSVRWLKDNYWNYRSSSLLMQIIKKTQRTGTSNLFSSQTQHCDLDFLGTVSELIFLG